MYINLLQEKKKTTKTMVFFYVVLLMAALYMGYCIGSIGTENLSLETLSADLRYAAVHPFPLTVTSLTLPAMAGLGGVWLVFMMKQFGD